MTVIRKLTPYTGSELTGLDARSITRESVQIIEDLIARRGVAVLPGQFLTDLELEKFGSHFGNLWLGNFLKAKLGASYAITVDNKGKANAISERWHADSTYVANPPKFTMLSSQHLPEVGGDTMWCNQHMVYVALPDGVKKLLPSLRAVHYNRGQVRVYTGADRVDLPGYAHPTLRLHPGTGLPSLYLSAHAEHFEGMSREESAPLLQFLMNRIGQPEFTYRHRWNVGDLILWDNRITTHYAIHDYGDEPRLHYRVTVEGDVTYGSAPVPSAQTKTLETA